MSCVCNFKVAYCINLNNPHAYSLAKKLAGQAKPNALIMLTEEEMKVLTNTSQFFQLKLEDKEV